MRKIGQYTFVLALLGISGYFVYQGTLGPCDRPVEYSLGRFDSEFGISKEEFKIYISEAEEVWEKALDRNIFVYDPDADFRINLVYDERQIATAQKQKIESGLVSVEDAFRKADVRFGAFKDQYDQRVSSYEKALTLFRNRKSIYDSEVEAWNNRGRVPPNVFQALEAERAYLNAEAARLNTEVITINSMAEQLNSLLRERNTKAAEFNKIAGEYNRKYDGGLEFNQAEYTGEEINVYQFSSQRDLVLALAHEFGHALNVGHVENPESIMYYLTGINIESNLSLSDEDLVELEGACGI